MTKLIETLKGKKTYVIAVAAAIVIGLNLAGILDREAAETILSLLGVGGLFTLRAAISKIQ